MHSPSLRFSLAALTLGLAFSAWSCVASTEPTGGGAYAVVACSPDGTCTDASSCVSGVCLAACATDADCPSDATCREGACYDAAGGLPPVISCPDATACPAGAICAGGTCVHDACSPVAEVCGNGIDDDCDGVVDDGCAACTDPATCACAAGLTLCGSTCVDVASDPASCGACGAACAAGQTCVAGVCTFATVCGGLSCDDGNACTVDACDPAVGCVHSPPPEICGNGVDDDCNGLVDDGCSPRACTSGTADCDGDPANGCEASLETDARNCGACAAACTAGHACSAGVCR